MSNDNRVFLALDTSYEHGAVALFQGRETLFEQVLAQKFAHGKALCHAIDLALRQTNSLDGVFCGLGPGSFVGTRIALATALGFCFGQKLPLMGFCSHQALAHSVAASEDFSIYMKASGDLGYFTSITTASLGTGAPLSTLVLDKGTLGPWAREGSLVYSDSADRMQEDCRSLFRIKPIYGPTPRGIVAAANASMVAHQGFVDQRAFIKPNYIKPPSVSPPKRQSIYLREA